MADRVVREVWGKPRRRAGLGMVMAGVLASVALMTGWLSAGSSAAVTVRAAVLAPQQQAINAKVNSLVRRMTVAEKFGQLEMAGPNGPNGTPGDLFTLAKKGQIGSVLDLTGVDQINAVQRAALQSRLHIPLIFSLDVIHGYRTMFPVPLGEASSWDPATVRKTEAIAATEATADGIKWTFNPMVDIARDPRWGRVVEGAGEDPFLGSAMAAAKVRAYQGSDFSAPNKMAATMKHFAAYGAPVAGRAYNTVDMSDQQLRNDYLPPYKAGVDAGVATVMSAFNSLNGVPASANPYLLQTILRDEWGFGGTVVSDYQAVQELEAFGYAATGADAARLALTAGVDIEMAVQIGIPPGTTVYSTYANFGPQLLAQGKITMAQLNTAVRHVLTLKYLAGMFANPFQGSDARVARQELTPAHLAAARTMADESMVLLNNNNHALPLSTSVSKIAVVGPLADNPMDQLGPDVPIGYPGAVQAKVVSVLQGIKNAVPGATVNYAQGCDPNCTDTSDFGPAVGAAQSSDVTVIVAGEPAADSGEASSRSMIDLPGQQLALIQQIAATGKPYVVVLMNGRPLTIPWLADNAPGLLEAWYPGTEGGDAVADVLFGKVNPGGKLTMSFPRNVGQIPIYYNELPTGRPFDPNNKYTSKYLDVPNTPQYPFGYGLSYTTFSVSGPNLSSTSIGPGGSVTVTGRITNTGSVTGDDVAQVYIHESYTSIVQPVRRLEGFKRITLAPGQTRTVTFHLGPQQLGFYNAQGQFVVEPGPFDVWFGDSSTATNHAMFSIS
ncbi:MAG: glycoside hydrolase family 3 C-terminal domain-containing protein [Solirubrobacterales bacterium]|nr:glycoside hydrolase family 3 C-terminal domain-containing protein [Solirubrobacterales bacterium]